MTILEFTLEQVLPVAGALYVLGFILKKSNFKDELIPAVLVFIGIAMACGLLAITDKVEITTAIIQGILATGLAIGANQGFKQIVNINKE